LVEWVAGFPPHNGRGAIARTIRREVAVYDALLLKVQDFG